MSDDDAAAHDHEEDGAEALGDIDVNAWGAAFLGAGIAILVLIALYVATQG